MKYCELCNLENPDDARFCMKCGKDLDEVRSLGITEDHSEVGSFTPAGTQEAPSYVSPKRDKSEPLPDINSYKEAATSMAESEEVRSPFEYGDETPEIHMTDVTADFTEKRTICGICGIANPHEQRYCRHCGAGLGDETSESSGVMSAPQATFTTNDPVETTLLTDMTSSSGVYDVPEQKRERRSRSGGGFGGGLAEWGAREWLLMIVSALVVAGLIWFFAFGGMNSLFNSGARDIRKAGEVMTGMTGCQYQLTATLKTHDAVHTGSGQLLHESPDKTAWQLTIDLPGRGVVPVGHVQIGNDCYSNCGDGWRMSDKGSRADLDKLWSGISGVEEIGEESMLGHACLHYRYRLPSDLVNLIFCVGEQSGMSDTVVDMWIDENSYQIIRASTDTFNIQIQGARTSASLVMDIGATDQVFNISAPI
ncbi:MAG: zinc ribbon domain-containing protein [Actinobacteria bacterium]|nr:zinc ribbon domain-containing protein [Actinomycetota bacterium]MCG2818456.1 zinc ribbon domain-containing protein [Actinomycetes bacterium]MBU4218571.1 zinc ribbon domain-containing protein [Actinomycetota bacterium]MBU4391583.1 zinc ribbon domain-containing protein [Actinomycetota bacterium]MBU4401332.1 zinc ribbon domain-containing protein [Actinomycetota bacterium]